MFPFLEGCTLLVNRWRSPTKEDDEPHHLLSLDDTNRPHLASEEGYGECDSIRVISLLDVCAVLVCLVTLLAATLVIFNKTIAIYLGSKYQIVVFGLLLSIQGFCTSRQVLLCAEKCLVRQHRATVQDLDALLRNAIIVKNSSWSVRTTLLALMSLPLLLAALYKPFIYGSTIRDIKSVTGQFGIIPPPNLDDINGNGITLAVNRMTPFWQKRQRTSMENKTFGENMLVLNENTTAMLDTPMIHTFDHLRTLLSQNPGQNESLLLHADVNATVATIMEISTNERSEFAKTFDQRECKSSAFYWCADLSLGSHAGMVLGGASAEEFTPAASPTINYVGIWDVSTQNLSHVVRKVNLTRQQAHGVWYIDKTSIILKESYLKGGGSESVNQDLVSSSPLNLDLFGQLMQEYNYRWYGFGLTDPVVPFMASITWARLATLNIEDRNHQQPWHNHANYTKPASTYSLQIRAQTVSRSPLLALIFVVNPVVVIIATIIKACLYTIPVSDGFSIISLLSCSSGTNLSILDGAGYSGTLSRKVWVWFNLRPATGSVSKEGKIHMHLSGSGPSKADSAETLIATQKYM